MWDSIVGALQVLVGATVGAVWTWQIQKRQWVREDKHRFAEQKRRAIADLLAEGTQLMMNPRSHPATHSPSTLIAKVSEVQMVCTSQGMLDATSQFGREVTSLLSTGIEGRVKRFAALEQAVLTAARTELGVEMK